MTPVAMLFILGKILAFFMLKDFLCHIINRNTKIIEFIQLVAKKE